MITKNKIGLLIIFISLTGFGQNAQSKNQNISRNNEIIIMENAEINYSNVVERTLDKVKRYNEEPMYFIRPVQFNCVFEILVNGFLVHKEYRLEKEPHPLA